MSLLHDERHPSRSRAGVGDARAHADPDGLAYGVRSADADRHSDSNRHSDSDRHSDTTFAGTGSYGAACGGSGGPATAARLAGATDVALDAASNVYIADYCVRLVNRSTGTMVTIAGTGGVGFSGDGGPATLATFLQPYSIAVDGAGLVYLAEVGNMRIRVLYRNASAGGEWYITTFAGNGSAGFGYDGVQATDTALYHPYGVAVDARGSVFIADTDNSRVRMVAVAASSSASTAPTATATSAGTRPPSSSATVAASPPATASSSAVATATLSPGASPSISPSTAPALFVATFTSVVGPDDAALLHGARNAVSDATLPLVATLSLRPASPSRVLGEPLVVSCAAAGAGAARLLVAVGAPAAGAAVAVVGGDVTVTVGVAFVPSDFATAAPAPATVTCVAAPPSQPAIAANASFDVLVQPVLWPFVGGALVQYPSRTAPYAVPADAPLNIVLLNATNLTLVADNGTWTAPGGPAFDATTAVSVGGVPCRVWGVAADGRSLDFEAPPYGAVCGDAAAAAGGGACPTAALAVTNAGDLTVACPPFCPGGQAPPAPSVIDAGGGAAAVVASALRGGGPRLYGGGVTYVIDCTAAGFTDPTLGTCANASDPRARRCAFGATSCAPCPDGAMCPGGLRAWPLPGWWSAGEASPVLLPCAAPAAARCPGWDAPTASVAYGAGYAPGSVACSLCAPGFFVDADGSCAPCQRVASFWQAVGTGVEFVGVLLLVIAGWVAVSVCLAPKSSAADVVFALRRSQVHVGALLLFVFLVLQAQAQVRTQVPSARGLWLGVAQHGQR